MEDDMTLMWAFERYLDCDAVPVDVINEWLLPPLVGSVLDLPDAIRARLCLRMLDGDLSTGIIDKDTLVTLQQLAACDVGGLADPAMVIPRPDLVLKVKIEVALQTFRPGTMLPAREAEAAVDELFADAAGTEEQTTYHRLKAALHSPSEAAALQADHPFTRLAGELWKFVTKARLVMPVMLKVFVNEPHVQDEAGAGGIPAVPGAVPAVIPAPAASHMAAPSPQRCPPAPPAAAPTPGSVPRILAVPVAAAPAVAAAAVLQGMANGAAAEVQEGGGYGGGYEGGYDDTFDLLPPQQQQQQQQQAPRSANRGQAPAGQDNVVQQLQARLGDLAQEGGEDPLAGALGAAAAAAAAAGAGGGGERPGRVVEWGEDSPAVRHPMPEMQRQEYARHSPLVLPSGTRKQQGGRAAAAAAAAVAEEGDVRQAVPGHRRKPMRWSEEEVAELMRLVKLHGRGSWATIAEAGNAVFGQRRNQVDLKDKWRNLLKGSTLTPEVIAVIEAREAELRGELLGDQTRRAGRPPKFAVSPPPKRQRRDGSVEQEEEEEDAVEDPDADAEEQQQQQEQQQQEQQEEVEEQQQQPQQEEEQEEEEVQPQQEEEEAGQEEEEQEEQQKEHEEEEQQQQQEQPDEVREEEQGGEEGGNAEAGEEAAAEGQEEEEEEEAGDKGARKRRRQQQQAAEPAAVQGDRGRGTRSGAAKAQSNTTSRRNGRRQD